MTAPDLSAYCVRCRERRLMIEAVSFTTKAGRPAVRGKCGVCGAGMVKLGGSNS